MTPSPDEEARIADRKPRHPQDIHRLLPQSPDAEQGLIASILLSPAEVMAYCRTEGVTEAYFHIPAHAKIYGVLKALDAAEVAIDVIALNQALRDRKILDEVGGPGFIADLFTFLPTAANAAYYLEILAEKYILREIIRVCTECAGKAYDEQGEVSKLVDRAQSGLATIANHHFGIRHKMRDMKTLVIEALKRVEALRDAKKDRGLPTGFPDLDDATGGLCGTDLNVIAGQTTYGKTALGLSIAMHLAVEVKVPVGIISLEMTADELAERLVAMGSRCNLFDFVNARGDIDQEFTRIVPAATRLAAAPIYIDDEHGITVHQMIVKARALKRKYAIQVLFLDYFQLLSGEDRSSRRREDDSITSTLTKASRLLKQLCKELGIPVVVLVQLNDKDQPEWASAIHKDSNNFYVIGTDSDGDCLTIRKQRGGAKNIDIPLYFEKPTVRFLPASFRPEPPLKKKRK